MTGTGTLLYGVLAIIGVGLVGAGIVLMKGRRR